MSAPVQSPLLRIPAKVTEEVDLAGSVGHLILNSYGQEPKQFSEQLSVLNRARQDAVRGAAGSDATTRDLLYKWFHMLEMLELRFPELRAPFPWKDAFTQKPITQHSLAYEKASVIFNIAAILSSIGARTHRIGSAPSASAVVAASTGAESPTSPKAASAAPTAAAASGTKTAYTSLRQAAGMLSYINDNFLHAPSTDMSKDVVRWLVEVQLAQATEVFWERTLEEKKGGNLVTRIASQAAVLYANLAEESKEWVTRGVFERSWSLLVQTKAKYFASVAQYYRALADEAASSHGSCLVRLTLSETLAKEAQKLCVTFSAAAGSSSSSSSNATLPPDSASSLRIILENHLGIVTARKTQAVKDNDLIYHDILPTESTLPVIEPMAVAQPISIQDIYASPEVQKVTGATSTGTPTNDLFTALVPLGVHEAASMYSEEKAKLARNESEQVEMANVQLETALESMSLPRGLKKFKPDGLQELLDPGVEVVEWAEEEIQGGGSRGEDGLGTGSDAIDDGLRRVRTSREQARQDLDEASRSLDEEAAQCEKLRVRHGDKWTQSPSGLEAKALRSDIKSNRSALMQASENDDAIEKLWRQSEPLIRILLGGRSSLEAAFAETLTGQGNENASQLVDLLQDDSASDDHRDALRSTVATIESNLSNLHRLKKERTDALTELRSRIQGDDISHILILNRRASADSQTQLFQQELEKFRPLTQRIARTTTDQERILGEISRTWKEVNEATFGRSRAQEWEKKNALREQLVANLRRAKDSNAQVRAGLAKGLTFYTQLQEIASSLRRNSRSFIEERSIERERLQKELDFQQNSRGALAYGGSPPPASSQSGYDGSSLESAFGRMGMNGTSRGNSLGQTPPVSSNAYGRSSMSPPPGAPPQQRFAQPNTTYDNLDSAFGAQTSSDRSNVGPAPPLHPYASPAPPVNPTQYASPPHFAGAYDRQLAPNTSNGQYGASSQPFRDPSQTFSPTSQRQPSLPPPPPQWQPSYGASSSAAGQGTQYGGPNPANLPLSASQYTSSFTSAPARLPPPSQAPQPYAQGNPYGSLPSPPAHQPYRSAGGGGPPPPPLPYQQQGPPPPSGQYGAPPPPPQHGSYGYGAPPPTSPYSQAPPPPPPPHQQQRWQPPY